MSGVVWYGGVLVYGGVWWCLVVAEAQVGAKLGAKACDQEQEQELASRLPPPSCRSSALAPTCPCPQLAGQASINVLLSGLSWTISRSSLDHLATQ